MSKVFIIDGGLGRCISSVPALIKYAKNNPNDEWYVLMSGWSFITYGIKELQDRTYEFESKGVYENIFLKVDEVVTPEPYRIPKYYKKEISLSDAFDLIINGTDDHSDLQELPFVFTEYEKIRGKEIVKTARETHKKDKTIVFQPYGSTAQYLYGKVFDDSLRSIPEDIFLLLSKKLSERYNVIYFGDYKFYSQEYIHCLGPDPDPHIREWMSIINEADYFIGCDSCGQHIANYVKTRGTVLIGSTEAVNISYPNFFQIIEKEKDKKYVPLRLSNTECDLAQRYNADVFDYSRPEIEEIFSKIVDHIENEKFKKEPELETEILDNVNEQFDIKNPKHRKKLLKNFDYQ